MAIHERKREFRCDRLRPVKRTRMNMIAKYVPIAQAGGAYFFSFVVDNVVQRRFRCVQV